MRLWLFVAFVAVCFAGGGGARDDIASLLYVRPAAVILVAAILMLPGRIDLRPVRLPLLLCVGLAAVMALQLVPLPPDLWTALPGRALLADAMTLAGEPQPWRPISIAPDLTLNSLAAMVVPIGALLGFAALDQGQRQLLLPVLIGAALVSILVGIAQLTSGDSSPLYLYRITNRDSAVGLFANRNHQAALLAISFPMLAVWAVTGGNLIRTQSMRTILAAALGMFLVPMIIANGSRAGLLFGLLAATAAWVLYVQQASAGAPPRRAWTMMAAGLGAIALAGLAFTFLAWQRASSMERLLAGDPGSDSRVGNLGTVADLAGAMQPFGSGFGTFDPLFRIHEPFGSLSSFYFNHAHNDLLELAITGGVAALLLLLAGLVWLLVRSARVFRPWRPTGARNLFGRLGAVVMLILLGWSLVDYPLRTPSLALVFAIAAGWLGAAPKPGAGAAPPAADGEAG